MRLTALGLSAVIAGFAGCADTYSSARLTLTGAEYAVTAMANAAAAYDAERDPELAQDAAAACAGKVDVPGCRRAFPALVEYRRRVDALRKGLRGARTTLGGAAAGVAVAELARAGKATVSSVLAELRAPLKELVALASSLGLASPALAALVGGL